MRSYYRTGTTLVWTVERKEEGPMKGNEDDKRLGCLRREMEKVVTVVGGVFFFFLVGERT